MRSTRPGFRAEQFALLALTFSIIVMGCGPSSSQPLVQSSTEVKQASPNSTLDLSGFGLQIPILTSPEELDAHVGRVVAIRGSISNTKTAEIIGVQVSGGQNLNDACAVGFLAKFVTTEEDLANSQEVPGAGSFGSGAGSFGPGTTYTLYASMTGVVAEAQKWGTGYTKDLANVSPSK